MKRGTLNPISTIFILVIILTLVASSFYFLSQFFVDKAIIRSPVKPRCIEDSLTMYFANVGRSSLNIASPPKNYLSTRNLIESSGFEEDISYIWETENKIDVILLVDRSGSMVGQGLPDELCKTPCDELGYMTEGDAWCDDEDYPDDCWDCDGREPSLPLIRRRDDRYADHSVPDNIHYEGDCPFNGGKEGAINFVNLMNPGKDRIGVISFSGETDDYDSGEYFADLESPLSSGFPSTINKIDEMTVGLYTGMTAAMRYGIYHFNNNPRPADKVMILLTDGRETLDGQIFKDGEVSDPIAEANYAASEGITIYTIGYGPNADEDTLQDIADATGGTYYFAATTDNLMDIYEKIAIELNTVIDNQISYYGNQSLKFPAKDGAIFYTKPIRLDFAQNFTLSQYIKIQNLQEGTLSNFIHLYENKDNADNFNEDSKVAINVFSAPTDDFDFTKYPRVIYSSQLDDECNGNPCEYVRLSFEWSEDDPEGTLWVDDIFFGIYMEYFQTIDTRKATLGEITIVKIEGDGDLYPYVDKAKVEAGESSQLKDANCAGERCKYIIMAGASVVDFKALC